MSTPMRAIEGILGIPPHTAIKTSSLDHEAEALRILADSALASPYTEANDPHGAALVHATLALVEQQRIANLIAFQNSFPVSPKTAEAIRAEVERGVGLL